MSQTFKLWKIILLLLLGLFVFLYIVANTVADVYYLTNPMLGITTSYDTESDTLYIEGVVPGGPADRAGLQEGDAILALNDVSLSEGEVLNLLKTLDIRKKTKVTVSRNGGELAISVEMNPKARFIFKSLLPGVIFCYTLFVIGTFVFLKRITDRMAHIFYMMVMFWALAMWDAFPTSLGILEKNILPHWTGWFTLPFWPMAVGLLLHFTLIFPIENKAFQKHPKLILSLIYSPLFLILPFIFADIKDYGWGQHVLQFGWSLAFFIIFGFAMHLLGKNCGYKKDPRIAKQAQIMFWGTALFLTCPTGYYFIPLGFFNYKLPLSESILLLSVLWPATLAYVIIKHRFMDIDIIIKRGVAYAILSGFVVAAYFLLVIGVGKFFLNLTGSDNQLVTIFATLLIAALFNPVKNRIQNFVDRRFFPNRFHYREAAKKFRHQLVNVVDLKKLFELLLAFLSDNMQIRSIMVLWRKTGDEQFTVRTSKGVQLNSNFHFKNNDVVIQQLSTKQQLLDLAPLLEQEDTIPDDERKKWDSLKTELVQPLLFKGKLIGMLSLGAKERDEPYYKEDLELLEALGDQINISLENALLTEELREQDRLKKELEVARRIQLSSLPQSDPQIPGLDISGISIPAMEVGGDYYDYLNFSDGRFGVVVGDVSGKGTSAALYMSQLKGVLKTAAKFYKSLKDLMAEINSITFDTMEDTSFITLTCGAFDPKSRKLNLVRAGHLPMIHYRAKEKGCSLLTPRGIGVGLENGKIFQSEIEEMEVKYDVGDIFLFFSDGITEARNSNGEEFETSALMNLIDEKGGQSASELREQIVQRVSEFSDNSSQTDDMTLVVVKAY